VEFGVFGGLIGYARTGRKRVLKLLWAYEVPLSNVPGPAAGLLGNHQLTTRPDVFF
jgi:hypothetical protein